MVELKFFATDTPDAGKKIVAFHQDGSGADLFYYHEDGNYYDAEGCVAVRDIGTLGFSSWDYLPDDFIFFVEDSSNDEV